MNEKSFRVLEWAKVRELVAARTSFSVSRALVQKLEPSTDWHQVIHRQALTSDALRLLDLHGEAPFGGAGDVGAAVNKAVLGGILEPDQLLEIADLLYCVNRLKRYLGEEKGPVGELGSSLLPLDPIRQEIERCVHQEGYLKDQASSELARLRQRIRSLAGRLRERLDALIRAPEMQKILQEALVTMRSGRYVVPVRSEYRQRFSGIVHDQSGSGATLFMEPSFSVELNNDLSLAEQAEQGEIERILRRLSSSVAEQAPQILNNLQTVAELDGVFARARYSRSIDGVEPQMNNDGVILIKQGRHPLLQGEVVPIDIWLGDRFHVLVITGPNTGGKTVTLKTVGLFCIMAQAGLHIPADPGSELAVFGGIYADIGDEQSIEQSLSTFSSHLTTIVEVLSRLEPNSLVLLDELGAGTDPTEGAVLATAILEYLRRLGTHTIATTHYSALKSYAYTHEGVENASVEFDLETLSPTYRLSVGIPGKSNALAISRRLGLNEEILEIAQSLLSPDHIQVEDVIGEMEANRRLAERERLSAERLKAQYLELKSSYERLLGDLEQQKQAIVQQAQKQAQELIAGTQDDLNRILGEARRQGRGELEENIKHYRQELSRREQKFAAQSEKKPASPGPSRLKKGEQVRIKSLRQVGFVLEPPVSGGDVLVQAGIMKITVKLADLERIKSTETAPQEKPQGVTRAHLSKSKSIRNEIDLRGKTVEEGLALLDKYLDDAFLSSLARVRIIHGKGTGVLGEAVQKYLDSHPHVKSCSYGAPNEGGHGVTLAEIHLRS